MIIKTIVPHKQHTYSSFPTFTTHNNSIYLFYRQGIADKQFVHGLKGGVYCWSIDNSKLLDAFSSETPNIAEYGKQMTVFQNKEENELDSIVSKLTNNLYTLVTRLYIPKKLNKPYISVSTTPYFEERWPIIVPGLQWFVLYGKAFVSPEGYIFPAYGSLEKEPGERVILLQTENMKTWTVLATLPLHSEKYILNESTVVFHNGAYIIFSRSNKEPFAIWRSTSTDLKNWSFPEKLCDYGHAPMAITNKNNIYLTYRDLSVKDKHAISLIKHPLTKKQTIRLDEYTGNLYDGGYSDLNFITDNDLFITYYSGNDAGEPFIKGSLIHIDHEKTSH